jgi:hypothetical protein
MITEFSLLKWIITAITKVIQYEEKEDLRTQRYLKVRPYYIEGTLLLEESIAAYCDLYRNEEHVLAGVEKMTKVSNLLIQLEKLVEEAGKHPELGKQWVEIVKTIHDYKKYQDAINDGYEEVPGETVGYHLNENNMYSLDRDELFEFKSPPPVLLISEEGDENADYQYRELLDYLIKLKDLFISRRDERDTRLEGR